MCSVRGSMIILLWHIANSYPIGRTGPRTASQRTHNINAIMKINAFILHKDSPLYLGSCCCWAKEETSIIDKDNLCSLSESWFPTTVCPTTAESIERGDYEAGRGGSEWAEGRLGGGIILLSNGNYTIWLNQWHSLVSKLAFAIEFDYAFMSKCWSDIFCWCITIAHYSQCMRRGRRRRVMSFNYNVTRCVI